MNVEKKEKMPSILLCFVPKTAGVYVWRGISEGLNLENIRISGAYFPGGPVMPPLVEEFSKGGYCTYDHLEASWRNKPIISAYDAYYGMNGVRIEEMMQVTKDSSRRLIKYPSTILLRFIQ